MFVNFVKFKVFVKLEGIMKMNVMLMTECLASVCKVWRYYENVMLMTECVAECL